MPAKLPPITRALVVGMRSLFTNAWGGPGRCRSRWSASHHHIRSWHRHPPREDVSHDLQLTPALSGRRLAGPLQREVGRWIEDAMVEAVKKSVRPRQGI